MQELLRWLLVNRPHSREAYSDRTSLLLAHFASAAYASGKADIEEQLTNEMGTPSIRVLNYHSAECEFKGVPVDTQYFTALYEPNDGDESFGVLAFRGTKGLQDWRTNLRIGTVELGNFSDGQTADRRVRVHEGFYTAFLKARDVMDNDFNELLEANVPLYVTGHSLGGALAQIAGAFYDHENLAACYTFGSPRVSNWRGSDLLGVKTPQYRVVNKFDIVPHVPPYLFGYRHFGDVRYIREDGSLSTSMPNKILGLGRRAIGLFTVLFTGEFQSIRDHSISNEYIPALAQIVNDRNSSSPRI